MTTPGTDAWWWEAALRAIIKREAADEELRQIIRDSLRANEVSPWAWCELLDCSRSSLYRRLGPGGAGLKRRGNNDVGGGWSTPGNTKVGT